jgi:molybdopterin molybdotransferase
VVVKSIHEALELMLPSFCPLPAQPVPLAEALGRVLASDAVAHFDLPEFDNSAMDGYALRAADATAVGCRLPVHGEARAGAPPPAPLPPGHAMRIFTGAPLPAGADSVVMQEDTVRAADGSVQLQALPRTGAHVRPQASDLRHGSVALRAGTALGPGELGLLASQDYGSVSVFRAPRVAILCTGDELRELGEPPRPGSLINSNAHALRAAVQQCGAVPWVLPRAPDVLLTVGGVSVGDYDLVGRALLDAGAQVAFHRVAMKPGKPLMFASAGGVPIVGLPGNPVSALLGFEVFVRPALRRMQGHVALFPQRFTVELQTRYEHKVGRTELARASLARDGERWVARLHARQGSGSVPSMACVDAVLVLPAEQAHFEVGCQVQALRLGPGPYTADSPWADAGA